MSLCSRSFSTSLPIKPQKDDRALINTVARYLAKKVPALYGRLPSSKNACKIGRSDGKGRRVCYQADEASRNGQTDIKVAGATFSRDGVRDCIGVEVFVALGDNDPHKQTYLNLSGTVYFIPLDQSQVPSQTASA